MDPRRRKRFYGVGILLVVFGLFLNLMAFSYVPLGDWDIIEMGRIFGVATVVIGFALIGGAFLSPRPNET